MNNSSKYYGCFWKHNKFAAIVLICLSVSGCGINPHKDYTSATDYPWTNFHRTNINKFISSVRDTNVTRDEIIRAYGLPDNTNTQKAMINDAWVFGKRRHGDTYLGKLKNSVMYQITYAIVNTLWINEDLVSCTIIVKSFIGDNKNPSAFYGNPVSLNKKSCQEFQYQ